MTNINHFMNFVKVIFCIYIYPLNTKTMNLI